MAKRCGKTTSSQYETMIDYLMKNREMMIGRLSSTFTSRKREDMWKELTDVLNADHFGPHKTTKQWRKTWSDLKSEVKTKAAKIQQHHRVTGGNGPPVEVLTPLQEKVALAISGMTDEVKVEASSPGLQEQSVDDGSGIEDGAVEVILDIPDITPTLPTIIRESTPTSGSQPSSKKRKRSLDLEDLVQATKEQAAASHRIADEISQRNAIEKERNSLLLSVTNALMSVLSSMS